MVRTLRKRTKLMDSNDAVVGIIVALLLIGLAFIVIAMVQTIYVPQWMEQREAEHMGDVANQFSQLKFAIDTQSSTRQKHIPISTPITLGSKEMSFLSSSRSFGSLDILSDEFTLRVANGTSSFSYSFGAIKYSSKNAYFLDQSYVYEAGAVILSQYQGNTMLIKPAFSVSKEENVSISFTIVNISTIGGKRSINGYGTYPIQTEYLSSDYPLLLKDVSNIIINTNYQNAWQKFLNNTLINSDLDYGQDKNFWIDMDMDDGRITINFTDSKTVNINLKFTEIGTQIAPGWIENIKGS